MIARSKKNMGRSSTCLPEPEFTIPQGDIPKVGFVVTRSHEGIFLRSLVGVLNRLPSDSIRWIVVCAPSGLERIRSAVRNPAVEYVTIPDRIDVAAEVLRKHELDVLYYWEICSDSVNYFLPFLQPAPIQCTSWGVQNTTGIPQMHYYFSSELVEPPDAAEHYTEELFLMKTLPSYQFRDRLHGPLMKRDRFGLPTHGNMYLCAQNLMKIHPDFDPVLAEILRRDPHGFIAVTKGRYQHLSDKLRRRWLRTMGELAARIVFVDRLDRPEYMQMVNQADVVLDTLYYTGVNTSYDALSLGKPIVNWPWIRHRGRYTYGCYRKMDFLDCVVDSAEGYVDLAVRLAKDLDYRRYVNTQLLQRSDVLFEDQVAVDEHLRFFEFAIAQARTGTEPRSSHLIAAK